MKKLLTLLIMACLTTAGFAFLPYDVSVTQRDATNTKFNTIYISASGAITDTASFRSTLGIPGLTVANTWTASQTYSGTGLRLIGDLSNATHANRLLWQTSTSNGNSLIGVLPNGTAKVAGFNAYGSSDPDNSSQLQLISDQTNSLNRINSKKTGTGTTLPVAIQFDDVTYVKFGTNGLTTIIANTTDPGTSSATDTLLHLVQADNVSARILGDSASNVGLVLTGRMSGGTMTSPSATPALNDLLVMAGRGYANGAYTATKAFIKLTALNTWTASDNSTFFTISLTPSGSTTVGDYFVLKSDNLNIPITTSSSSPTTGAVTIGNGTRATNVGIGGGNINAGGNLGVDGTSTLTGGGTFTGTLSPVFTSMGALAVDVTKAVNTYSATGDVTFTYSATPAAGTRTLVRITADSSNRTITIPSTWSLSRGANITSLLVPANTTLEVLLQYVTSPSARWEILGDPPGTLAISGGGTGATTSYGAYDNLSGAETAVASAATTDLGAVMSNKVSITGTTTITSFGTAAAGIQRWGRFTGSLTLTYNATSLILPGAANITTAAGDSFMAVSLGSGNWVVYNYTPANGRSVISTGQFSLTQGNNSMSVTAGSTVYIGNAATNPSQANRYKKTLRFNGTITNYTFSYYGAGGGANACTVTLLLNGVTTIGSTTIAGNVFPSSVTVTGLSQTFNAGDTIEVTFLNHASNASITSFIGNADVGYK